MKTPAVLSVLALALLVLVTRADAAAARKPNVLFICINLCKSSCAIAKGPNDFPWLIHLCGTGSSCRIAQGN